ncbi:MULTISPECIES: DUF6081 family protein [Streptomyces]|uniref:DUF6081 family protein n=1 Tax=Streptomyces eurythermus TaxID=42237 RepID=A0ABW6Z4X9_9ACTN|nr:MULTISPECIES: DUF6081 family protein [Streptomyces]
MSKKRLRSLLVAGSAALALAVPVTAASAATDVDQSRQTVFSDDFGSGFDTSESGRWQLFQQRGLTANDGVTTTGANGLNVVPSGTDAATGAPAFAFTTGQESAGGQGDADHMKWMAYPRHNATSGYPGWDVPATGSWACASSLSVTERNMNRQPFGSAVSDPDADIRLGSGGLVGADLQTGVVVDFHVTNNTVYAWYERLRFPGSTYAAFTYAVPVAKIAKGTKINTKIIVGNGGTTAHWILNGINVLTVDRLGTLALDRKYLLTDHGGTPEAVSVKQLTCGLGLFTVLDGAGADGKGLVRLSSGDGFYFAPRQGAPAPATFADENSLSGNRLWGQGVNMQAGYVRVSTG